MNQVCKLTDFSKGGMLFYVPNTYIRLNMLPPAYIENNYGLKEKKT